MGQHPTPSPRTTTTTNATEDGTRSPAGTRPAAPVTVIEVTCTKMYVADLIGKYAFMMWLPVTNQSFTAYADTIDAFRVGAHYTLTLTPASSAPAAGRRGTATRP